MSLKMESPATPLQTHKFQAQNSHPFSEPARYGPHQPPPSAAQEPSGPGLSSDPTHALSNPPVAHTNGNTAPLSPVHSANNAVNGVNASPASHSTQNVAGVNSTPVSVPTATPVNKERTRHSSACFPCAKRKVKCDRDVKNPCSNCLKRDQGHLCEVKSQKDRLSHGRNGLAQDGHRDKRPKFEVCINLAFAFLYYFTILIPALCGLTTLLKGLPVDLSLDASRYEWVSIAARWRAHGHVSASGAHAAGLWPSGLSHPSRSTHVSFNGTQERR